MHRDFEALQAALDRERARRNAEAMSAAENDYLEEPEPKKEPMRCEECGCVPYDSNLYNHDGDWLCSDCLLERFPVIDCWDY